MNPLYPPRTAIISKPTLPFAWFIPYVSPFLSQKVHQGLSKNRVPQKNQTYIYNYIYIILYIYIIWFQHVATQLLDVGEP